MEMRSDRRFGLPALEIVIGDERYRAINWSLKGALLYGFCDIVGARVRGGMAMPGSSEAVPFAGTVIRADLDANSSAICFEDPRTEAIEFHAAQVATQLQ